MSYLPQYKKHSTMEHHNLVVSSTFCIRWYRAQISTPKQAFVKLFPKSLEELLVRYFKYTTKTYLYVLLNLLPKAAIQWLTFLLRILEVLASYFCQKINYRKGLRCFTQLYPVNIKIVPQIWLKSTLLISFRIDNPLNIL